MSLLMPASWAATCTYSEGAWDQTPAEGDDIVIVSGNLTWGPDLPLKVASWTQGASYTNTVTFDTGLETFEVTGDVVLAGGMWTHTANPAFNSTDEGWISGRGTKQLIVSVGGNFTLSAGASIDVVNKGFRPGDGPGYGKQGLGASHGGSGISATGRCYGSFSTPVTLGSGGRDPAGGGAVRLTVAGTAVLDGSINANCSATGGDYHGAGGSILIEAFAISGSGEISADGAGHSANTSAGGGGRIAFKLTGDGDFSSFTGSVHAYSNGTSSNKHHGSCGTIYYEKKSDGAGGGTLVLNGRTTGFPAECAELTAAGDEETVYDLSCLAISNCAVLVVHSNVTLKVRTHSGHSSALARIKLRGGRLEIPEGTGYESISLMSSTPGSEIACGEARDLVLGNGAQLIADNVPFEVTNLVMKSGASIVHSANSSAEAYRLNLVVYGDALIEEGAKVSANERGLSTAKTMPQGCTTSGSHGGVISSRPSEAAYGSLKYPVNMGSPPEGRGERGGGAIRMTVYGNLVLDGGIEAIGATSNGATPSPSGGSIWLTLCGGFSGSGNISANGGYSRFSGTVNGSGGRVAVYLTQAGETYDAFFASGGYIEASGANSQDNHSSAPWGGPGTVYLSKIVNGAPEGTLVIANRDSTQRTCAATIGANVTDTEVDHVEIQSNGVLKIGRDATLKVSGNFTTHAKGKFVVEAGDADHASGNVEFTGTGESLITGTNEFARFTCKTPGKTIRFGSSADTLTRILSYGGLDIAGEGGSLVKLRGVDDDTPWVLDTVSGSDNKVAFADIKNSNAGLFGGSVIVATDSTDSGGNESWSFPVVVAGAINTWIGEADGQWGNPANWDLQRAPVETDVIVISAEAANMPTLPAAVLANSLTVESGATLTLAGYFLTVTNELRVAGSLVCEASETVEFSGTVLEFADGAFTKASSTLLVTGAGAQSLDPGGNSFNVVRVAKDGGSVSFADGFEAYQLWFENETSLVEASFAAGSTVTTDDIIIDITDAAKTLVMRSCVPGEKWNLAVSRLVRVSGVAVSDSNATDLEICDDLPGVDNGGNSRWRFGTDVCKWTGAVSTSFTNDANWAGGTAPGENSRVQFLSDAAVVLESPVSVRQFEVLAGEVVFSASTNGALNVAEAGAIDDGATLSMNIPLSFGADFTVRSGATLTHKIVNSTDKAKGITNRVDLTVGGDMTIEEGGVVTAKAKGFGVGGVHGGFGRTAKGEHAPSHASIASLAATVSVYDSVFAPIHPGSSCVSGDAGNTAGGVIRLRVGGELIVDGVISADSASGNWYVSTPGSIWITAGDLSGSGDIGADAGPFSHAGGGNIVGGGRVAVILTEGAFSRWSGVITANPNNARNNSNTGSPGTVYLETAADGDKGGTVYVVNTATTATRVVPASRVTMFPGWDDPADFERVRFVVGGLARIGFTEDMRIADITFKNVSNAVVPRAEMYGCKVKVDSGVHRDGKGWDWTYGDIVLPGDAGTGRFIWPAIGFRLIIR